MSPTFTFTAANGTPFLVRLVRQGDPYGAEMRLVHDETYPEVEFYDTRYPFAYDFVGTKEEAIAAGAPVLGQFTAGRYYVHTLRETRALHGRDTGLALNGSIAAWIVDPASMHAVHAWLDEVEPPLCIQAV